MSATHTHTERRKDKHDKKIRTVLGEAAEKREGCKVWRTGEKQAGTNIRAQCLFSQLRERDEQYSCRGDRFQNDISGGPGKQEIPRVKSTVSSYQWQQSQWS